MHLLVTGGAGFIGTNFIHHHLRQFPEDHLANFDLLTYAGNAENLSAWEKDPRYVFLRGDVAESAQVEAAFTHLENRWNAPIDAVIHFAAESHVDRSIADPAIFVRTNVQGTQVLLEAARRHGVKRFIHVSTDEVYGSLESNGSFDESTPLAPNSPYSASKAGADLMARAYSHTYGFPVIITRCSNNYGPYQFPEKLIPLMIANALEGKPLPVYGDGGNIRDWIYVEDHCRGIEAALANGKPGEIYHFGGHAERTNLEIVRTILHMLHKPESLIQFVADRPGHDRRYAMATEKAERELGWRPQMTFEAGLEETIRWYLSHQEWVAHVRSGAYRDYYKAMYEDRRNWLKQVQAAEVVDLPGTSV